MTYSLISFTFDGDVHSDVDDFTTHLVTMATPSKGDKQVRFYIHKEYLVNRRTYIVNLEYR